MTLTASSPALLHVALQDLRAGKAMQHDRLAPLSQAVSDARLAVIVAVERERAATQMARLDSLGNIADGPRNLWMGGILDDAERDAGSHQHGLLRDVALAGALRKAKAAEIVSTETALLLAQDDMPIALAPLLQNRREEIATDHALRHWLTEQLGALPHV